jgi:hypothetical protein
MPYTVTQGSGLNIDSITYTHPTTGLLTHIPVITNQTVSSVGTNTGGIGTTAYAANQVMGTSQFTFPGVALKAGLGGVIQNASLYCAVVSTGQYLIKLFDKPITNTFSNGQLYSAFPLSDIEAQSFVGDIEFSFPAASANNTLYSVTSVGMSFTTDSAGQPNLYGILLARNAHTLTGATGQDIRITLEILL